MRCRGGPGPQVWRARRCGACHRGPSQRGRAAHGRSGPHPGRRRHLRWPAWCATGMHRGVRQALGAAGGDRLELGRCGEGFCDAGRPGDSGDGRSPMWSTTSRPRSSPATLSNRSKTSSPTRARSGSRSYGSPAPPRWHAEAAPAQRRQAGRLPMPQLQLIVAPGCRTIRSGCVGPSLNASGPQVMGSTAIDQSRYGPPVKT